MPELVAVFALLAVAAALTMPTLSGFGRSTEDATARLYLTTVIDAEVFHYTRTGEYAVVTDTDATPLPRLTATAAGALSLTAADIPPAGTSVSAALSDDGATLGLATQPGDTCWYAVRTDTSMGDAPDTLFAYSATNATPCTGDAALDTVASLDDDTGFGRTPATPLVVP